MQMTRLCHGCGTSSQRCAGVAAVAQLCCGCCAGVLTAWPDLTLKAAHTASHQLCLGSTAAELEQNLMMMMMMMGCSHEPERHPQCAGEQGTGSGMVTYP